MAHLARAQEALTALERAAAFASGVRMSPGVGTAAVKLYNEVAAAHLAGELPHAGQRQQQALARCAWELDPAHVG